MAVLIPPVFCIIFLCLPLWIFPLSVQRTTSEALNDAVGLKRGEYDIHQPQAEKEGGGEYLWYPRASELTPNFRSTSVHEDSNGDEGKYGEEGDRECQCSGIHIEGLAFRCMVNGSYGPCHTNAQKHINSIAPSDITNGGICILVLNCSNFTGKSVCHRREKEGFVKFKDWD